jgi:anti-sigma28 factor (negative regulator of flagellin synthesis)
MSDPKRTDRDLAPGPEKTESLYSPEYLKECASGEARQERLEELKRRIALGAYRVNADWVAEEILQKGGLDPE